MKLSLTPPGQKDLEIDPWQHAIPVYTYCGQDTLAMVKIRDELLKRV